MIEFLKHKGGWSKKLLLKALKDRKVKLVF